MTKIWFNHWFSTAFHLINLMKSGNESDFIFIGTSTNSKAVYREVCDEWYDEPADVFEEEYVDFCLKFCEEHAVDVFVPRRNMAAISARSTDFSRLKVKLFADLNADLLRILDSKTATYDYFRAKNFDIVPNIKTARSAEEFESAYNELKRGCERVCYKLSQDEGARSFRVIDDRINDISALLNAPNSKISLENALKILRQYDFKIPILVMPYLGGQEISVDCLKTAAGYIILPRYKNGRYSHVELNSIIMDLCAKILDETGLEMPANIQFKTENGKPFLLEINPRMSGGLQLSCAATGINIPKIAVENLLGNEIPWEYPSGEIPTIVNLETPVILT